MKNQCDGCAINLKIINGIHVLASGYPHMVCVKDKYEAVDPKKGNSDRLDLYLTLKDVLGQLNRRAPCRPLSMAKTKIEEAIMWLEKVKSSLEEDQQ